MGKRFIKQAVSSVAFLFLMILFLAVPANAKTKIIQNDVRLPEYNIYIQTDDGKMPDKNNVALEIKDKVINPEIIKPEIEDVKKASDIQKRYYILFDVSTSVSKEQFEQMKQSVKYLAQEKGNADEISIITFGEQVRTVLEPTSDKNKISKTLGKVAQEKKTHLYEGISNLADKIESDRREFMENDKLVRQQAIIITDWQEIKNQGGLNSSDEALSSMSKTGVPLQGFCLRSASVKLQDQMGESLRKTNGEFLFYDPANTSAKDPLVKYHKERLDDYIIQTKLASSETSDQAKTVELKIDDQKVADSSVYFDISKKDEKAPEIIKVEEKEKKDTLVLTFSESVKNADEKGNYTVTSGNTTYAVETATYIEAKNKVKLIFNKKLKKGTYTISTTNITDYSDQHNPLKKTWSGEIEGLGIVKNILDILGSVWPLLVVVIVALILFIIYRVIKKNKGLMVIDDKIVTGDKVGVKQHIKQDGGATKYIAIRVESAMGEAKQLNVQVISSMIVGRSETCDIYFDDLNMSKQHFAIEVENGTVFINDLESTNGTFVNGKKINGRVPINPGDVVKAGNISMLMRW